MRRECEHVHGHVNGVCAYARVWRANECMRSCVCVWAYMVCVNVSVGMCVWERVSEWVSMYVVYVHECEHVWMQTHLCGMYIGFNKTVKSFKETKSQFQIISKNLGIPVHYSQLLWRWALSLISGGVDNVENGSLTCREVQSIWYIPVQNTMCYITDVSLVWYGTMLLRPSTTSRSQTTIGKLELTSRVNCTWSMQMLKWLTHKGEAAYPT
jgi:hypothetical protein